MNSKTVHNVNNAQALQWHAFRAIDTSISFSNGKKFPWVWVVVRLKFCIFSKKLPVPLELIAVCATVTTSPPRQFCP